MRIGIAGTLLLALTAVPSAPPLAEDGAQPAQETAPGTPVNFTWRFQKNSGGVARVKMFARARGNVWPSANTNWRMDGPGLYSFTTTCRHGEKMCYGGWKDGDTDSFWGTGFENDQGCSDCCYTCVRGQSPVIPLDP